MSSKAAVTAATAMGIAQHCEFIAQQFTALWIIESVLRPGLSLVLRNVTSATLGHQPSQQCLFNKFLLWILGVNLDCLQIWTLPVRVEGEKLCGWVKWRVSEDFGSLCDGTWGHCLLVFLYFSFRVESGLVCGANRIQCKGYCVVLLGS